MDMSAAGPAGLQMRSVSRGVCLLNDESPGGEPTRTDRKSTPPLRLPRFIYRAVH